MEVGRREIGNTILELQVEFSQATCQVCFSNPTWYHALYFKQDLSVLFLHNRQGTSEFPVYEFQESQYGFRRTHTDSGVPIRIQEGQYGTVCAFLEGQYGTVCAFQEGQYGNLFEIECKSFIHSFIDSLSHLFPPTAVRCRHAQTVKNMYSSYKIYCVIVIQNFLKRERHQNRITGSKVTAILVKGQILPIGGVALGAPAASAGGLFLIHVVSPAPQRDGVFDQKRASKSCLCMRTNQ